nr:hypothetical protein [uncultured Desulfobulbus sp.]
METQDRVQAEQALPELPDGIGLSMEEVRMLLAVKNSASVSPDDPILMVVTVLNAFLSEEEKLLDRHSKALTAILTERTDGYVKAVEQTATHLGESLSSASAAEMTRLFSENTKKIEKFKQSQVWLAAIVTVSALVNVAVFVLR